MTRRAAFELLAERALLEGNEELNMAFLLSHKHLLRSHPSRVLLELWIKHVKQDSEKKHAEALAGFMRLWARHFFSDLRRRYRANALSVMPLLGESVNNELKLLFLQANYRLAQMRAASSAPVAKSLSLSSMDELSGLANTANKLFSVKEPLSIAVELTQIESHLFVAITEREFLDQAWQRENKILLSPNLTKIIERFNQVSYWVVTSIIAQSAIEKQAWLISKFIRLALDQLKIRNYNGVAEITSALNSSSIQRLKNTWALLPERHSRKLQKLQQLMQPPQNFWNYRECFEKVSEPKIPYLAVVLRDITFINIGNSNYQPDGSINLDRLIMLYKQVKQVRKLQKSAQLRDFKDLPRLTEPSLIEYCQSLPFIDNDEFLHELAARFMIKSKDTTRSVESMLNSSSLLSLFHISDSSDSSLSLTISKDKGREGDDSWSVLTSETETETESIIEEEQDDHFDDDQDDAKATLKVQHQRMHRAMSVEGYSSEESEKKGKKEKKEKEKKERHEEEEEVKEVNQSDKETHKKKKKRHTIRHHPLKKSEDKEVQVEGKAEKEPDQP